METDLRFMFHIWSQMEGGPCKPGNDHRKAGPCHLPAKQLAEDIQDRYGPTSDEQLRTAYRNGFMDGSNRAAQRIGGAITKLASPHWPEDAQNKDTENPLARIEDNG